MKRIKVVITFAVLAIMLLLFVGCVKRDVGKQVPPEMPEKIVVQAPMDPPAPPTAPLLKMKEDGLPGTRLELIFYKSVEEATTRVVKGEADFTVLPLNVAAKLYNKQVDISLANVSTWGILYLVTLEEGVENWTDLKDRALYVGAQGSTPDVLTQYLLRKSGLQKGDVKINYLGSQEIAQMMISGLAKNAVLPEPVVTQVLMNNPKARVVRDFFADWQHFEGETTRLPQAGMVVRNEFARSYPKALAEFQSAYAKAIDWTVANPSEAALLMEANLKMPAPVFVKSMERTRIFFVTASQAKNDVNTYLARLLELSPEMVGGKLPDEKFYLAD